jgi:hypothetical protein
MKILYFLFFLIGITGQLIKPMNFNQKIVKDSSITNNHSDSVFTKELNNDIKNFSTNADSGEATVTIKPEEAKNATIIIIKKAKSIAYSNGNFASLVIIPDTISVDQAPISKLLGFGEYDIIVRKNMYKTYSSSFTLIKSKKNIQINLIPYSYLDSKKNEWSKYKWISAGIAAVATLSSFYFKSKIHTYTEQYKNSITYNSTIDNHNKISSNQTYYKISSSISFAALASFIISWFTEAVTYNY